VVTLNLPPLRERREDIPLLADYFLARFSRELDMPNPGLTPEAVEALSAHHWPGNVRELGNALHKALIFSRGAPLTPEDVLAAAGSRAGSPPEGEGEGLAAFIRRTLTEQAGENAFDQLMDHVGRLVVREALEITGGNRTRAARLLGLSRPTLLARIEKYGLKIGAQVS
jgi:two-component system NtrC family response regulator/two-component system nitrogen regulation response regulator GlnG